jgi:hypothetical protein
MGFEHGLKRQRVLGTKFGGCLASGERRAFSIGIGVDRMENLRRCMIQTSWKRGVALMLDLYIEKTLNC